MAAAAAASTSSVAPASSNISVALRIRPLNQSSREATSAAAAAASGTATSCVHLRPGFRNQVVAISKAGNNSNGNLNTFEFDNVFQGAATQQEVYEGIGLPILLHAMKGYSGTLFSYGQTSSGKTHTMLGSTSDPEHFGIVPRLCQDFFDIVERQEAEQRKKYSSTSTRSSWKMAVSCMEVYNEQVRDLIASSTSSHSNNNNAKPLDLVTDPKTGAARPKNLTEVPVFSSLDVMEVIDLANRNRSVAATNMNQRSSRSHCIFQLSLRESRTHIITKGNMPTQSTSSSAGLSSKVYLVDLAGSERTKSSGVQGQQFKEANAINLSLTTLGRCIDVLLENATKKNQMMVVPFRESKLTMLLRDSLGGNAMTTLLAAVSPAPVNAEETLGTLRFAARARCVVNAPTVNEDPSAKKIRELEETVRQLQEQLARQPQHVQRSLRSSTSGDSSSSSQQQLQIVLTQRNPADANHHHHRRRDGKKSRQVSFSESRKDDDNANDDADNDSNATHEDEDNEEKDVTDDDDADATSSSQSSSNEDDGENDESEEDRKLAAELRAKQQQLEDEKEALLQRLEMHQEQHAELGTENGRLLDRATTLQQQLDRANASNAALTSAMNTVRTSLLPIALRFQGRLEFVTDQLSRISRDIIEKCSADSNEWQLAVAIRVLLDSALSSSSSSLSGSRVAGGGGGGGARNGDGVNDDDYDGMTTTMMMAVAGGGRSVASDSATLRQLEAELGHVAREQLHHQHYHHQSPRIRISSDNNCGGGDARVIAAGSQHRQRGSASSGNVFGAPTSAVRHQPFTEQGVGGNNNNNSNNNILNNGNSGGSFLRVENLEESDLMSSRYQDILERPSTDSLSVRGVGSMHTTHNNSQQMFLLNSSQLFGRDSKPMNNNNNNTSSQQMSMALHASNHHHQHNSSSSSLVINNSSHNFSNNNNMSRIVFLSPSRFPLSQSSSSNGNNNSSQQISGRRGSHGIANPHQRTSQEGEILLQVSPSRRLPLSQQQQQCNNGSQQKNLYVYFSPSNNDNNSKNNQRIDLSAGSRRQRENDVT